MEIKYLKLIKIDHENNSVSDEPLREDGNVSNYVMEIIAQITENAGDRSYKFRDTDLTMKTWIDKIVNDDNREENALNIANRLLDKENTAQIRYHNITDIQKGILLIAYCKMNEESDYKMVICKVDYTEFIEETTGDKRNGLPTKKKIFKSFAASIKVNAGVHNYINIITYDVNAKQSKYWYDEFLDLEALRNDEVNTERAFSYIRSKILDPIKKTSLTDHLVLWNRTVAYMRSEGEFSIEQYADEIIGAYNPFVEGLDMKTIAEKVKELPKKHQFDSRFQKVPQIIKAKMKKEIKLTSDIDLVLKNDIPYLERTIQPYTSDDGTKYIMVRSEEGYKYAESLGNQK